MSLLDFLDDSQPILDNFGNHIHRYTFQVDKYFNVLVALLKENNLSFEEYFFNLWKETEYQLMLLEALGKTKEDKLNLINLFFAFQYLKMNIECVHMLEQGNSEGLSTPYQIYRDVLVIVRQSFFSLSRGLMNRLSYYSEPSEIFSFAIFNVGSLVDHEDLDVGLIIKDNVNNVEFDRYIGRLSQKFFKSVTRLHFYMAEALNLNQYGGTTKEYIEYLETNKKDYIFVSQLLGATRLTGDMELFYTFKAQLVERYFRGTSKYRKEYIDVTTKEIEYLCSIPLNRDVICPKTDCYRIFTILTSSLRIAYQIHRGNIWETFDQFLKVDPSNRIYYELIKDAYAFVQILRYLFNLYVCQKDRMYFNDPAEGKSLDKIAVLMGYINRNELLKDYNYISDKGRQAALYLAHHLRKSYL